MQHLKTGFPTKQAASAFLLTLLLILAVVGRAQAAAVPAGKANPARPLTGYEGSRNNTYWAGYEAVDWYSYKEINGHWTVPSVSGEGDAAQWVGFNGDPTEVPSDFAGPLVQIGTDSIATSNQDLSCLVGLKGSPPPYFAWAQVIGHGDTYRFGGCGVYLFAVNPGDQITASISLSGDYAYLALDDTTNGRDWVKPYDNEQTMSEYTAEWTVERSPGDNCPPLLANFGTTAFSSALLKAGNNVWYPITYNSYLVNIMTDYYPTNGHPFPLTQVSGLSAGNTAFTVQWLSRGIEGC